MRKRYSRYSDIIDLPHHQSEYRPHMPVSSRAVQFAPFAALVGYEDMVNLTTKMQNRQEKKLLDENRLDFLNKKISVLRQYIHERPYVEIIYFDEMANSTGGAYVSSHGEIKRVKDLPAVIELMDGREIYCEDIYDIHGEIFEKIKENPLS